MTIRVFFNSIFKVDLVSLGVTRHFDLSVYGQLVKDNSNL
jgi:hypothetical protein